VACRSPQQALEALRKQPCQLALVDLNYVEDTTSGKEGLRLISDLRAADEELPIIAMTGWGTIGIAVEAMQRGAADFIEKPWKDNNRLLTTLRTQMKLRAAQGREKRLSAENELLRADGDSRMLICQSPAMAQVLGVAKRVAASPMPILITGENGTGKSLLAGYIHRHSPFAHGPFISVNMGAIAETTFESEMFGHTRGAFTDARSDRIGRVELADQGTLFMDEIANLPLAQQAKILRLLEERHYEQLAHPASQHPVHYRHQCGPRQPDRQARLPAGPALSFERRHPADSRTQGTAGRHPAAGRELPAAGAPTLQQLARAQLFSTGTECARELRLARQHP
jgi:DNA-binding NtrC family response regulator